MAKRGGLKLVLLAADSAQMRTFNLSRARVTLIFLAIVILVGAVSYGASRFMSRWFTGIAMAEVLDENRELRQHLDRFGKRLTEIDSQIGELARSDDRLRLLADMPKIDQDVRQVGIGGLAGPDMDYGNQDEMVRRLIFDLDKMEREIRLQRASFIEIEHQFRQNADLIAHTPSIRPVDGGYVSSGFGRRRDPFNGRWTHHNGVDISVERGTPVLATAEGEVVFAKRTPGLGLLVIIDHGYGFRTAYGHLSSINISKAQRVTRGQKIGEVGNTGRSTAPHLHYEVHVFEKAVDPLDYFFESNATLLALP